MSKGLEALKRITLKDFILNNDSSLNDIKVIEKELKEKAKFDAFMKRYNIDSVEELDTFFNEHLNNDIDKCSKCKELKTLEIIKEHIRLDSHKYESDETYGLTEYMFFITKEEYDLLKEVLC